jgi:hypothetical protein
MTFSRRPNYYFVKHGWERMTRGWNIYTPQWVYEIR